LRGCTPQLHPSARKGVEKRGQAKAKKREKGSGTFFEKGSLKRGQAPFLREKGSKRKGVRHLF